MRFSLAGLLGLLFLSIGCGDDGEGPGGGGGSGPQVCNGQVTAVEDVCSVIARARCRRYERCNQVPAETIEACVRVHEATCDERELPPLVQAGKVQFDGEAFACCWAQIAETSSCFDEYLLLREREACGAYAVGTDGPGAACEGPTCRAGTCVVEDSCPGECVAFAKKGEKCDAAGCEPGLICDTGYDGATDRCFAIVGPGKPCGFAPVEAYCESDSYCDGPAGSPTGICTRRPTLGQACTTATSYCDGAHICLTYDDGSRACGPLQKEGTACYDTQQCAPELFCDRPSEDAAGVCERRARPGGSCVSGFQTCLYPAVCSDVSARCEIDGPAAGEACDPVHGPYCASGLCDPMEEKCVERLLGQVCTSDTECSTGVCGGDGKCREACALE